MDQSKRGHITDLSESREVLVCLLISTHALPPFSYRVPDNLAGEIGVGSAVITPLSGYSRLGFVVGVDDEQRPTEEIRGLAPGLSLDAAMIEVCQRVSEAAAAPLAGVLRAALPPGLNASRYRVVDPAPDWRWKPGRLLGRTTLRRALGSEALKLAERDGRVALAPEAPSLENARNVLLESRGDEKNPEIASFQRDARGALEEGGPWIWRVPTRDQARAAAAVARESVSRGEQALVLVPEIEAVERIAHELLRALPRGNTVGAYHSQIGKERASVHQAARCGAADVVVGTRAASLLPMRRAGVICVVDEPDEAHRAEPGYEGVPRHARDVALERSRVQDVPAIFLSPAPSLGLYARKPAVGELPPRRAKTSPRMQIVDMRGTGAPLSPTLLDLCRRHLEDGRSVGVIVGRVGYATVVSCSRCGAVRSCPDCDLPLALHRQTRTFVCNGCGRREPASRECPACGARRLTPTGLAAERVWEEVSEYLGEEAGLVTADLQKNPDAPVRVGTSRYLLREEWDAIAIPDLDAHLLGSGVAAAERAFRLIHRSREAARRELVVQTRLPEHYALRDALRGDYPSFASAELSRRRSFGYAPFSHSALLTLEGPEEAVKSAVKSRLRPAMNPEVEVSEPVPAMGGSWRVLLRARTPRAVAQAGAEAARMLAKKRGPGAVRVRVEVDPEDI